MKKVSLTGIKPTGTPHIGNYLGAFKPAIELSKTYDARYFIADYHALNAVKDPLILRNQTLTIAAAWLASGLDPEKVVFFKQSDTPEVLELFAILNCFVLKSRLNGAHAYKAFVDENLAEGRDPDAKINGGLFTYPVLMAADILLYDSEVVPVGKDQLQHIEIAVDIAEAFNRTYGGEFFTLPKALEEKNTLNIPGADGRKMSKSYDNVIPLFSDEKTLKKAVMRIVTTSQSVEEPKDPETCNVFAIYRLFAKEDEIESLRKRYLTGPLGWGEAKEALYSVLNRELSPLRERYFDIIKDEEKIKAVLKQGAEKARVIGSKKLALIKKTVGIL